MSTRHVAIIGSVIGGIAGASFGHANTLGEVPSLLAALVIGALFGAAEITLFESVPRIPRFAISFLLGVALLAAILSGLFGAYVIASRLLDNPLTGPMIKWFPNTMGQAVSAVAIPAILAAAEWLTRTRASDSPAVSEIRLATLLGAFGAFVGGAVATPVLLLGFTIAFLWGGALPGGYAGTIVGLVLGAIHGGVTALAVRGVFSLW